MEANNKVTVNFSNFTFSFIKFQEQYKNLCQNISTEKKYFMHNNITKIRSFLFEYLAFVKSQDMRNMYINYVDKINNELNNDEEFERLRKIKDKGNQNKIIYYQKYYEHIIKIFKFIGSFGDELSKTFMPNKSDREKYFRYWNNNAFFEQFTTYKSKASEQLSQFKLHNFNEVFIYFLGFYFAYYLFIDEESRVLCERIMSNILNIILTNEILSLMICNKSELTNKKIKKIQKIENVIHKALASIFFRCNYSYSQYNVLPRIENKVLTDKTLI